jgi:signal transduction histidine kinase
LGFETARLRLAEIKSEGEDTRLSAYRVACEQSARTLGVERVSVWMLNSARDSLQCTLRYTLSTNSLSEGGSISAASAPEYFAAVLSRRVVVVPDAYHDPITSVLGKYLIESQVGALLDVPIYRDGVVVGVVCHEHVGGTRKWSEGEASFASAVADMLTILIDQAERAELRAAIDAQLQLEAQGQKMQALVKLARVVTHDLSNLLTIATLRADTLSKEKDIDAASHDISQVLSYGNQLLRHLKDFCAERVPTGEVHVLDALRHLEPVIQAMLGKDIKFELTVPDRDVVLGFSRIEFEQVVMNLVGNARDAITGEVKISTLVWCEGGSLYMDVVDNGRGMPPATRDRLFEPFYSTKEGHTGIGLAAVYGIVRRANGEIDVISALGEGTTFHLAFPIKDTSQESALNHPWDMNGG